MLPRKIKRFLILLLSNQKYFPSFRPGLGQMRSHLHLKTQDTIYDNRRQQLSIPAVARTQPRLELSQLECVRRVATSAALSFRSCAMDLTVAAPLIVNHNMIRSRYLVSDR